MDNKVSFVFQDNTYEVKFPNNGQYLRIQNLKTQLAPNLDVFSYIGAEGQVAASLVDAEAHLSVLCPKFITDLKKPFSELELKDTIAIAEIYSSIVRPWYNNTLNVIFGVNKEKEDVSDNKEQTPDTER